MDKICTNPNNCTHIVTQDSDKENHDVPLLLSEIKPQTIDSILSENIESFHIHQYGSTVIFLQYLEGLEIIDEIIAEYSNQGHVFMLPMKAMDLIDLKSGKMKQIIYKAVENDTSNPWYKIKICVKQNQKFNIKNIFKRK